MSMLTGEASKSTLATNSDAGSLFGGEGGVGDAAAAGEWEVLNIAHQFILAMNWHY